MLWKRVVTDLCSDNIPLLISDIRIKERLKKGKGERKEEVKKRER